MKKIIEIKGLTYTYPDGRKALSGIDLEVVEGESLGIIGPNGAGKSTLLLHLNGILRGEGEIRICGLPLKRENLRMIRQKVGLVFQDPDHQLFMPTVFDDVAFGPLNMGLSEPQVREVVRRALKAVDMLEAESRSSHHLSFGQRRRVSLATVLSMNPVILALDEPSSNLDPGQRRNLINFLKSQNSTKLIATHDLELVLELCSRVVLVNSGKIVAEGETSEILGNKPLLEEHSLEIPASLRGFFS